MTTPRTSTPTLIAAMRALARDIESQDGVANAAILEAAERLDEVFDLLVSVSWNYDEIPCWLQAEIDDAIKSRHVNAPMSYVNQDIK